MGRKCSHCGSIGHNSRTCTNLKGYCHTSKNNVVRLFGVEIEISSSCFSASSSIAMKKNFSLDCLSALSSSSPSSSLSSLRFSPNETSEKTLTLSCTSHDDLICKPREKKKGVPWTEEEHRTFLIGLQKLGKGDWRGISRNFVTTRTPTQVASHAQKYFLRSQSLNISKKNRRRFSLFDMVEHSKKPQDNDDDDDDVDQEHHVIEAFSSNNNNNNNVSLSSNGDIDLELTLGAPKNVDNSTKQLEPLNVFT